MMAHEFNGLEAKLMSEGILMVKMCIFADRPKQCKTIGKRLGRGLVADMVSKTMDKAGTLTPDVA